MDGHSLKNRRKAIGLSQQDMAVRCGVSFGAYRMWEYGMPPKPENLEKLEQVFEELEAKHGKGE